MENIGKKMEVKGKNKKKEIGGIGEIGENEGGGGKSLTFKLIKKKN